MSKDLRQFLQSAKEAGPDFYVEVKKPLKPKLEVHVIQTKLQREGRYPVVYCPQIEGSKLSLVTNLFNSYELLALALGMDPKTSSKSDIRPTRWPGMLRAGRSTSLAVFQMGPLVVAGRSCTFVAHHITGTKNTRMCCLQPRVGSDPSSHMPDRLGCWKNFLQTYGVGPLTNLDESKLSTTR